MGVVDLELTIQAVKGQGYVAHMWCTQPDNAVQIDTSAEPLPIQIDHTRLLGLTSDPAAYGLALGQMVFVGSIATTFAQARAAAQRDKVPLHLRLVLVADAAALHTLRWETLRDPSETTAPLLTTGAQVVFSRYLSSADWQPVKVRSKGPLRALIVLASPPDLSDFGLTSLDLETERVVVAQSFGHISTTVLGPEQANLDTLTAHLHDGYDILYLFAHGRTDTDGETWLYLEGREGKTEAVLGSELTRCIAGLVARPWLIVLGSCESAGVLRTLGPQLAQAGVGAVLAMQDRITVETLQRFLPACFQALRERAIDQAVAKAREAVRDRPDFWVPVLFLRFKSGLLGVQMPSELGHHLHNHTGFMQDVLANFVGRAEELKEVQRRIAELLPTGGYVTITAQAGQGKSSIIAKLVELALREHCGAQESLGIAALVEQAGPAALAYHFISLLPGPDYQIGLLCNLITRLILKYNLSDAYVRSESRSILCNCFARVLEEVAKCGGQEVIYIDGLDQIEEDNRGVRDLSFLPPNPRAGIVFVLGTRSNDTLQSLEQRTLHHKYELPPLSRADFDLILQRHKVVLQTQLADRFYRVMEANALYLDLVARELAKTGALTPEQIISRIADNPNNLFSLAIGRLELLKREWLTLIKPILGVLLTAQEPLAVASIRTLIGQEDKEVRKALARLGGLLTRDSSGRYTLFHLKLRDFLREDPQRLDKDRVFAVGEEQDYHQKLADWCERGGLTCIWQDTMRDTGEQERRAYARLQYITHLCRAQNWLRLWEVLDQSEYGEAKLRHDPSTHSFMLDLDTVRQAMVAVTSGDMAEGVVWLPRLWKYSLLRCSLSSQADNYPEGLLELMAQLGRDQEAIGLAEVLTDQERKVVTLVRIGQVLGQQGREDKQQQLLARAVELAQMTRCLRVVIGVFVQEQALERAMALVWQLPKEERVEMLGKVVTALAQAQRLNEARELAQQIPDLERRVVAQIEIVAALAQAQQFEGALKSAQEIPDTRERSVALGKVVTALAQAQRFEAAQKLTERIPDTRERAVALGKVVTGLAQAQRFEAAQKLTEHIPDARERAVVLGKVVAALAQAQRFEEALTLTRQILDAGERIAALGKVVSALAQDQRFGEALTLIRRIFDAGERIAALGKVVAALAQAQRFGEALTLTQQILDPWQRIAALGKVIVALAQAQRFEEVLTLAQEVITITRYTPYEGQGIDALVEIVCVLAQAQRIEEALGLAKIIPDTWLRARVLEKVIHILMQTQHLEMAKILAQYIPDARWRAGAMTAVVEVLVKIQQIDAAMRLLQEVVKIARYLPDTEKRAEALVGVMTALVQSQQLEVVMALVQAIPDNEERAEILVGVVAALTQDRWLDEALMLARLIVDGELRTGALMGVVAALVQTQQLEAAMALAQEIPDGKKRAEALAGVVDTLRQTHRTEDALELTPHILRGDERSRRLAGEVEMQVKAQRLEKASVLAKQIPDLWWRGGALAEVVEALVKVQRLEEASDLAKQIPDPQWRAGAIVCVMGALAQTRQLEKAIMLAQEILDSGARVKALLAIAQQYAYAERWDDVIRIVHHTAATPAHATATVPFISSLPHLPTVLILIQRLWSQATRRDDLYELLPAAIPLFVAYPTLLPQILAGEVWAKEQLKKQVSIRPVRWRVASQQESG